MRTQSILGLVAMYVGLVDSFAWDIVLARDENRLEFYSEGKLTYSEEVPIFISWVTFDPVDNRLLLGDQSVVHRDGDKVTVLNCSITSYDLKSMKTQCLIIKKKSNRWLSWLTYDPATELLFGSHRDSIYSFLLKPGNNNEIKGDLVINFGNDGGHWHNVAVDSCGGYIYRESANFINSTTIQRVNLNGTEKEVVIESSFIFIEGLTIDQQAQKMYWIDEDSFTLDGFTIESADLNGKNRRTLYGERDIGFVPDELTISNDFIFWGTTNTSFWQLPKNSPRDTDAKPIITSFPDSSSGGTFGTLSMAANYKFEEQVQGGQNCPARKRLLPNYAETNDHDHFNASTDVSLFCVNGTKVSGQPRCECTPGYIGERCDVSICQNYCFQGDCDVNAEGQTKCRCNAGFSGERCEVNACHKHCLNNGVCSLNEEDEAMCQCTADYEGERCDVSICQNYYCFQGDCIISAEGHPQCRCNAGYSGERCDSNACHGYCLNSGVCYLNKNSEPVCQCIKQYEGERCDVPVSCIKCLQKVSLLKEILNTDTTPVTLGEGLKSTNASIFV